MDKSDFTNPIPIDCVGEPALLTDTFFDLSFLVGKVLKRG